MSRMNKHDLEYMILRGAIHYEIVLNNVKSIRTCIDETGFIPSIAYRHPYNIYFAKEIEQEEKRQRELTGILLKKFKESKEES